MLILFSTLISCTEHIIHTSIPPDFQSAVDDQSINYTETCQQILNAINGSSQAAQEDLMSAVKDSFSGHIATQFGSNRQTDQSASSNHANMVAGGAVGASANGQPSLGMNNGHSRPGMNPCQQFMGAAGPHGGFTSKGMGAGPGSQMMPFQVYRHKINKALGYLFLKNSF